MVTAYTHYPYGEPVALADLGLTPEQLAVQERRGVTTSGLHVIGSTHQARCGESFDAQLAEAIEAADDSVRAGAELDELTLLAVLAHYAAAGLQDPDRTVIAAISVRPEVRT